MDQILISNTIFEVSSETLNTLRDSGAVMLEEESETWILNPDHQFTYQEVLMLVNPD